MLIFTNMKSNYIIIILLLSILFSAVTCDYDKYELIFYVENNSSTDLVINIYPEPVSSGVLNITANEKIFFESIALKVKEPEEFLDFYDSVIVKSANDGSVLLKYINNNDPADNEFWQVDNWEEVTIDGGTYEYTYEYTFTIDDDDL